MGWLSKAFRTAVKNADKIAVQKLLPRVKAEDLLPIPLKKNTEEDEKTFFVEAEIDGDIKDLYEHLFFDSPEYGDEYFSTDMNDTVLMLGARTGDAQIFSELMTIPRLETVINFQNPSNETALLVAEKEGQLETVLTLLQQPKIDVTLKDNNNETVLTYAAAKNDIAVVNVLLLHHQMDVNSRTTANDTALTIAARKGHTEVVASLLKHTTIDVNAINEAGETALICAAREGHTETAVALLAYPHIDPNAFTVGYKDTALMWAARNNHASTFLHLLAHPSIDATIINKDGQSALDLAETEELARIIKIFYTEEEMEEFQQEIAQLQLELSHTQDYSILEDVDDSPGVTAILKPEPLGAILTYEKPPSIELDFLHQEQEPKFMPQDYISRMREEAPGMLVLVCLAIFYIFGCLFVAKKPRARAARITTTTEGSEIASSPGKGEPSQKELPGRRLEIDPEIDPERAPKRDPEREPCCPFCPTVSLIAIHNRHIQCLQVGIVECGPHDDACTLACRSNLVEYLDVLRSYNAPWGEETTRAAATQGHLEALQYIMERNCPYYSDDIVYYAACAGSLPVLRYLVETQACLMHEDGRVFGAAFERADLECITYLLDTGCPCHEYSFGGADMWPTYERYLDNHEKFDARLKACIIIAVDHGWNTDAHLAMFVNAHADRLPECAQCLRTL
eukprot:gene12013-13927_t